MNISIFAFGIWSLIAFINSILEIELIEINSNILTLGMVIAGTLIIGLGLSVFKKIK